MSNSIAREVPRASVESTGIGADKMAEHNEEELIEIIDYARPVSAGLKPVRLASAFIGAGRWSVTTNFMICAPSYAELYMIVGGKRRIIYGTGANVWEYKHNYDEIEVADNRTPLQRFVQGLEDDEPPVVTTVDFLLQSLGTNDAHVMDLKVIIRKLC